MRLHPSVSLALTATVLCVVVSSSVEAFHYAPLISKSAPTKRVPSLTRLSLFGGGGGKIPKSASDRDQQAISAVKAALGKPKTSSLPLLECEFPPLKELNKLGDGSMRSANEVDQANLAFCSKLIGSISLPLLGPKTWLLTSSASSNALNVKAASTIKGSTVASLRNGLPDVSKGDICVLVAPNGRNDYIAAQTLAASGIPKAVILINGLAKDVESVPGTATMAYYLKPLTYNSQVAGYLVRCYPQPWTAIDVATQKVLGSFTDAEILFGSSNTPDLRAAGRLVQKATDDRAIQARRN